MAQEHSAPPEAEPGPPDPDVCDLPSAELRPTVRMPLSDELRHIGRAPDNDLVLADLSVSRKHAVLRKSSSGRYEIFDLDSHNGTYVNGIQVRQAAIGEDDIIGIGHATLRLTDGELRGYIDTGDVSFEARNLTVLRGDKVVVDQVSFPVEGRSLVAVIGPSGAGKSTLLGVLSGLHPADTGTVLYENRDLYQAFAELRHRIGDSSKAERAGRVDEVLEQLGLTERADARTKELSGGQQKRVNIALELLNKPSLLFLDEPTSGLDPGLDAQFMEQMRDLAHDGDGRTIILVTHSVENLHTCDRLLVLARGGKVAYYGPPDEALTYYGHSRWADVFREFEEKGDRDWAGEFRQSREHARYVVSPMIARPRRLEDSRPERGEHGRPAPVLPPGRGRVRQLGTLTRRYLRLITTDRLYWPILLVPFFLGAIVYLSQGQGGLEVTANSTPSVEQTLLILMIMACPWPVCSTPSGRW